MRKYDPPKAASAKDKSFFSNVKIMLFFATGIILALLLPLFIYAPLMQVYNRQHAAGTTCTSTGVGTNPDGSYSFAWLHLGSNGDILDDNNCFVSLLGINQGGLFLDNANGKTDLVTLENSMAFSHQNLHSNLVRVNYNAYWWVQDVYVPKAQMHFRQWLQTYVNLEKKAGNYVLLDSGTEFREPPCGNDGMGYIVTYCPPQNQAQLETPVDPTETAYYEPTAVQALADLAKLYANDPAILFDVMNEPADKSISETTLMQDMNERINTIRQYAPKTIVVVYDRALNDIMSGQFPNFTQQQIMFDAHIYSSTWTPSVTIAKVNYAQQNGEGFMISEWGAQTGQPTPSVMIPFLQQYKLASAYFRDGFLLDNQNSPTQLTSLGQAVANGYAGIIGSPPPSPVFTDTPMPTGTTTLSPTPPQVSPTVTPTLTPTPTPKKKCNTHSNGASGC